MGSPRVGGEDPFRVVVADRFTLTQLAALASGTAAAVHVPGFLPAAVCRATAATVEGLSLQAYDPSRVYPPIARFGPVINDFRRLDQLSPDYWQQVELADDAWKRAGFAPDPVQFILGELSAAWARPVHRGRHRGRELFAGIVREINSGTRIHFDDVRREFPAGILDDVIATQLAFNAYIAMPATGGETTIWRRRWRPTDEDRRAGYGYGPEVVAGAQQATVRPEPGDALLFDSRLLHAVSPCDSRRITLSFFAGLGESGSVTVWS